MKLSTLSTAPTTTYYMTLIIIITLLLISCAPQFPKGELASAQFAPSTPLPAETVASDGEPYAGTVYEIPAYTPKQCARVTAYNLNMRTEPMGIVIHWLYQDQIVTVTDTTGEWWQIKAYETSGYAHSAYLERTPCHE